MGTAVAIVSLCALGSNPAWPAPDPQTPSETLARPEYMPDDPDYRPHPDPIAGCGGQLELYSFIPDCTQHITSGERDLLPGSGIAIDRAWLWTTGRPEVAIAVVDSGLDWSDPELVLRVRLNPGELPIPSTSATTASSHDANKDGIFNVQDYSTATGTTVPTISMISDPRLLARTDKGDANHNGILDPEDLIIAFSNNVDEDKNGFVDDIAGWDFFADDNDPADPDPVHDGRGTLHARSIAATANNGIGGAGACPSCSIIPVRASANGIAEGTALAASILYSVGRGAKVIAASPSAAGGSRFVRSAAAFAIQSDVLIVAPAGNASSLRQEVAWDPDKVLIVAGIGYDDQHKDRALSAVAPDPCSNFGPQVSVAAPARCSETNAAIVAGAAGLLYAASLGIPNKGLTPLTPPLSAREAIETIEENASDIPQLFGAGTSTARNFAAPTSPPAPVEPGVLIPFEITDGWDGRTGQGRVEARRAIDAVIQRRIPPEVEILSPDWSAMIDPSPVSGFAVMGRVANRRSESASWVLEYAVGAAPRADAFSPIASGSVDPAGSVVVSGTVPTDALFDDPTSPPVVPNANAITIRLSASVLAGNLTVRGETRRVVFVHRDLEILPAFPLSLGAAVTASPRLVDLDGDGKQEILVATDDGAIHAIDRTGRPLSGWPQLAPGALLIARHSSSPSFMGRQVPADSGESILGAIAASGAERGREENGLIVAVTTAGRILAFDRLGHPRPGFPILLAKTSSRAPSTALGVTQAPVLVDLDGDGPFEIVQATPDGAIHAIASSGRELPGFPIILPERTGSPAAGDLDGDRKPDLVAASDQAIYVLYANGKQTRIPLPARAFDPRTDGFADEPAPSPALGDVNGDGVPEIVIATRGRPVLVYKASGGDPLVIAGSDRASFGPRSSALASGAMIYSAGGIVALADLDADGTLDSAASASSVDALLGLDRGSAVERLFSTWSLANGAFTQGAPHLMGNPAPAGCAIADIDGDQRPEVIVADGDGRVEAFALDGTQPRRWPKLTGSWVQGAPALGDLGGDGTIDVVVATRSGLLFAWRTSGVLRGTLPWAGFQHDATSSGNVATPTAVFTHVDLGSGCTCKNGAQSGAETALFAIAICALCATWRARRR